MCISLNDVVELLSFLNCASDQYCRDGKKTTTLYNIENIAIVKIVNSQYLKSYRHFNTSLVLHV